MLQGDGFQPEPQENRQNVTLLNIITSLNMIESSNFLNIVHGHLILRVQALLRLRMEELAG